MGHLNEQYQIVTSKIRLVKSNVTEAEDKAHMK